MAKERQPELAWEKANFMLKNNINPLQAMADLLKVVRDNPTHPEAIEWLRIVRTMVTIAQPAQISANPGAASGDTSTRHAIGSLAACMGWGDIPRLSDPAGRARRL